MLASSGEAKRLLLPPPFPAYLFLPPSPSSARDAAVDAAEAGKSRCSSGSTRAEPDRGTLNSSSNRSESSNTSTSSDNSRDRSTTAETRELQLVAADKTDATAVAGITDTATRKGSIVPPAGRPVLERGGNNVSLDSSVGSYSQAAAASAVATTTAARTNAAARGQTDAAERARTGSGISDESKERRSTTERFSASEGRRLRGEGEAFVSVSSQTKESVYNSSSSHSSSSHSSSYGSGTDCSSVSDSSRTVRSGDSSGSSSSGDSSCSNRNAEGGSSRANKSSSDDAARSSSPGSRGGGDGSRKKGDQLFCSSTCGDTETSSSSNGRTADCIAGPSNACSTVGGSGGTGSNGGRIRNSRSRGDGTGVQSPLVETAVDGFLPHSLAAALPPVSFALSPCKRYLLLVQPLRLLVFSNLQERLLLAVCSRPLHTLRYGCHLSATWAEAPGEGAGGKDNSSGSKSSSRITRGGAFEGEPALYRIFVTCYPQAHVCVYSLNFRRGRRAQQQQQIHFSQKARQQGSPGTSSPETSWLGASGEGEQQSGDGDVLQQQQRQERQRRQHAVSADGAVAEESASTKEDAAGGREGAEAEEPAGGGTVGGGERSWWWGAGLFGFSGESAGQREKEKTHSAFQLAAVTNSRSRRKQRQLSAYFETEGEDAASEFEDEEDEEEAGEFAAQQHGFSFLPNVQGNRTNIVSVCTAAAAAASPSLLLQYRPRSLRPLQLQFDAVLSLPVKGAANACSQQHFIVGCARQPALLFLPLQSVCTVRGVLYVSDFFRVPPLAVSKTHHRSDDGTAAPSPGASAAAAPVLPAAAATADWSGSALAAHAARAVAGASLGGAAGARTSNKDGSHGAAAGHAAVSPARAARVGMVRTKPFYLYAPRGHTSLVDLLEEQQQTQDVVLLPDAADDVLLAPSAAANMREHLQKLLLIADKRMQLKKAAGSGKVRSSSITSSSDGGTSRSTSSSSSSGKVTRSPESGSSASGGVRSSDSSNRSGASNYRGAYSDGKSSSGTVGRDVTQETPEQKDKAGQRQRASGVEDSPAYSEALVITLRGLLRSSSGCRSRPPEEPSVPVCYNAAASTPAAVTSAGVDVGDAQRTDARIAEAATRAESAAKSRPGEAAGPTEREEAENARTARAAAAQEAAAEFAAALSEGMQQVSLNIRTSFLCVVTTRGRCLLLAWQVPLFHPNAVTSLRERRQTRTPSAVSTTTATSSAAATFADAAAAAETRTDAHLVIQRGQQYETIGDSQQPTPPHGENEQQQQHLRDYPIGICLRESGVTCCAVNEERLLVAVGLDNGLVEVYALDLHAQVEPKFRCRHSSSSGIPCDKSTVGQHALAWLAGAAGHAGRREREGREVGREVHHASSSFPKQQREKVHFYANAQDSTTENSDWGLASCCRCGCAASFRRDDSEGLAGRADSSIRTDAPDAEAGGAAPAAVAAAAALATAPAGGAKIVTNDTVDFQGAASDGVGGDNSNRSIAQGIHMSRNGPQRTYSKERNNSFIRDESTSSKSDGGIRKVGGVDWSSSLLSDSVSCRHGSTRRFSNKESKRRLTDAAQEEEEKQQRQQWQLQQEAWQASSVPPLCGCSCMHVRLQHSLNLHEALGVSGSNSSSNRGAGTVDYAGRRTETAAGGSQSAAGRQTPAAAEERTAGAVESEDARKLSTSFCESSVPQDSSTSSSSSSEGRVESLAWSSDGLALAVKWTATAATPRRSWCSTEDEWLAVFSYTGNLLFCPCPPSTAAAARQGLPAVIGSFFQQFPRGSLRPPQPDAPAAVSRAAGVPEAAVGAHLKHEYTQAVETAVASREGTAASDYRPQESMHPAVGRFFAPTAPQTCVWCALDLGLLFSRRAAGTAASIRLLAATTAAASLAGADLLSAGTAAAGGAHAAFAPLPAVGAPGDVGCPPGAGRADRAAATAEKKARAAAAGSATMEASFLAAATAELAKRAMKLPPSVYELPIFRSAWLGAGTNCVDSAGSRTGNDAGDRLLLGSAHFLYWGAAPHLPAVLYWQQVPYPPLAYTSANWPLRQAATSPTEEYLLTCGTRGFAVFSFRRRRWRLLGDEQQEQQLPTGLLPQGWYTPYLFFISTRVCDAKPSAKAAALAAAAPLPRSCVDSEELPAHRLHSRSSSSGPTGTGNGSRSSTASQGDGTGDSNFFRDARGREGTRQEPENGMATSLPVWPRGGGCCSAAEAEAALLRAVQQTPHAVQQTLPGLQLQEHHTLAHLLAGEDSANSSTATAAVVSRDGAAYRSAFATDAPSRAGPPPIGGSGWNSSSKSSNSSPRQTRPQAVRDKAMDTGSAFNRIHSGIGRNVREGFTSRSSISGSVSQGTFQRCSNFGFSPAAAAVAARSGYALLFFDVRRRFDLNACVAVVRRLPARPLRTALLSQHQQRMVLPSSRYHGCTLPAEGEETSGPPTFAAAPAAATAGGAAPAAAAGAEGTADICAYTSGDAVTGTAQHPHADLSCCCCGAGQPFLETSTHQRGRRQDEQHLQQAEVHEDSPSRRGSLGSVRGERGSSQGQYQPLQQQEEGGRRSCEDSRCSVCSGAAPAAVQEMCGLSEEVPQQPLLAVYDALHLITAYQLQPQRRRYSVLRFNYAADPTTAPARQRRRQAGRTRTAVWPCRDFSDSLSTAAAVASAPAGPAGFVPSAAASAFAPVGSAAVPPADLDEEQQPEGSSNEDQLYDVLALWQVDVSCCWVQHPLQLRFLCSPFLLLVHHANGDVTALRVRSPAAASEKRNDRVRTRSLRASSSDSNNSDPGHGNTNKKHPCSGGDSFSRKAAGRGEMPPKQKRILSLSDSALAAQNNSLHLVPRLVAEHSGCIASGVTSVWLDAAAQLPCFCPLPVPAMFSSLGCCGSNISSSRNSRSCKSSSSSICSRSCRCNSESYGPCGLCGSTECSRDVAEASIGEIGSYCCCCCCPDGPAQGHRLASSFQSTRVGDNAISCATALQPHKQQQQSRQQLSDAGFPEPPGCSSRVTEANLLPHRTDNDAARLIRSAADTVGAGAALPTAAALPAATKTSAADAGAKSAAAVDTAAAAVGLKLAATAAGGKPTDTSVAQTLPAKSTAGCGFESSTSTDVPSWGTSFGPERSRAKGGCRNSYDTAQANSNLGRENDAKVARVWQGTSDAVDAAATETAAASGRGLCPSKHVGHSFSFEELPHGQSKEEDPGGSVSQNLLNHETRAFQPRPLPSFALFRKRVSALGVPRPSRDRELQHWSGGQRPLVVRLRSTAAAGHAPGEAATPEGKGGGQEVTAKKTDTVASNGKIPTLRALDYGSERAAGEAAAVSRTAAAAVEDRIQAEKAGAAPRGRAARQSLLTDGGTAGGEGEQRKLRGDSRAIVQKCESEESHMQKRGNDVSGQHFGGEGSVDVRSSRQRAVAETAAAAARPAVDDLEDDTGDACEGAARPAAERAAVGAAGAAVPAATSGLDGEGSAAAGCATAADAAAAVAAFSCCSLGAVYVWLQNKDGFVLTAFTFQHHRQHRHRPRVIDSSFPDVDHEAQTTVAFFPADNGLLCRSSSFHASPASTASGFVGDASWGNPVRCSRAPAAVVSAHVPAAERPPRGAASTSTGGDVPVAYLAPAVSAGTAETGELRVTCRNEGGAARRVSLSRPGSGRNSTQRLCRVCRPDDARNAAATGRGIPDHFESLDITCRSLLLLQLEHKPQPLVILGVASALGVVVACTPCCVCAGSRDIATTQSAAGAGSSSEADPTAFAASAGKFPQAFPVVGVGGPPPFTELRLQLYPCLHTLLSSLLSAAAAASSSADPAAVLAASRTPISMDAAAASALRQRPGAAQLQPQQPADSATAGQSLDCVVARATLNGWSLYGCSPSAAATAAAERLLLLQQTSPFFSHFVELALCQLLEPFYAAYSKASARAQQQLEQHQQSQRQKAVQPHLADKRTEQSLQLQEQHAQPWTLRPQQQRSRQSQQQQLDQQPRQQQHPPQQQGPPQQQQRQETEEEMGVQPRRRDQSIEEQQMQGQHGLQLRNYVQQPEQQHKQKQHQHRFAPPPGVSITTEFACQGEGATPSLRTFSRSAVCSGGTGTYGISAAYGAAPFFVFPAVSAASCAPPEHVAAATAASALCASSARLAGAAAASGSPALRHCDPQDSSAAGQTVRGHADNSLRSGTREEQLPSPAAGRFEHARRMNSSENSSRNENSGSSSGGCYSSGNSSARTGTISDECLQRETSGWEHLGARRREVSSLERTEEERIISPFWGDMLLRLPSLLESESDSENSDAPTREEASVEDEAFRGKQQSTRSTVEKEREQQLVALPSSRCAPVSPYKSATVVVSSLPSGPATLPRRPFADAGGEAVVSRFARSRYRAERALRRREAALLLQSLPHGAALKRLLLLLESHCPFTLAKALACCIRKLDPLQAPAALLLLQRTPQATFAAALEAALLHTASLYLLILQQIEGPLPTRRKYALRLIAAGLRWGVFDLAKSVLAFCLIPLGGSPAAAADFVAAAVSTAAVSNSPRPAVVEAAAQAPFDTLHVGAAESYTEVPGNLLDPSRRQFAEATHPAVATPAHSGAAAARSLQVAGAVEFEAPSEVTSGNCSNVLCRSIAESCSSGRTRKEASNMESKVEYANTPGFEGGGSSVFSASSTALHSNSSTWYCSRNSSSDSSRNGRSCESSSTGSGKSNGNHNNCSCSSADASTQGVSHDDCSGEACSSLQQRRIYVRCENSSLDQRGSKSKSESLLWCPYFYTCAVDSSLHKTAGTKSWLLAQFYAAKKRQHKTGILRRMRQQRWQRPQAPGQGQQRCQPNERKQLKPQQLHRQRPEGEDNAKMQIYLSQLDLPVPGRECLLEKQQKDTQQQRQQQLEPPQERTQRALAGPSGVGADDEEEEERKETAWRQQLEAALIYVRLEEIVGESLLMSVLHFQWLRVFELISSLALDFPAWLVTMRDHLHFRFSSYTRVPAATATATCDGGRQQQEKEGTLDGDEDAREQPRRQQQQQQQQSTLKCASLWFTRAAVSFQQHLQLYSNMQSGGHSLLSSEEWQQLLLLLSLRDTLSGNAASVFELQCSGNATKLRSQLAHRCQQADEKDSHQQQSSEELQQSTSLQLPAKRDSTQEKRLGSAEKSRTPTYNAAADVGDLCRLGQNGSNARLAAIARHDGGNSNSSVAGISKLQTRGTGCSNASMTGEAGSCSVLSPATSSGDTCNAVNRTENASKTRYVSGQVVEHAKRGSKNRHDSLPVSSVGVSSMSKQSREGTLHGCAYTYLQQHYQMLLAETAAQQPRFAAGMDCRQFLLQHGGVQIARYFLKTLVLADVPMLAFALAYAAGDETAMQHLTRIRPLCCYLLQHRLPHPELTSSQGATATGTLPAPSSCDRVDGSGITESECIKRKTALKAEAL